jgi:hypothetical protein
MARVRDLALATMSECARPDSDERVPRDNLFLCACRKDLESNEHICCKHVGQTLHLPHAGRFSLASLLQARRARCSQEQRAPLLQARRALRAGVAAGKHVFTRLCCSKHACTGVFMRGLARLGDSLQLLPTKIYGIALTKPLGHSTN